MGSSATQVRCRMDTVGDVAQTNAGLAAAAAAVSVQGPLVRRTPAAMRWLGLPRCVRATKA